MDKIFNPDNPIMRFLAFFCDLMYVNALFIIFSIPIFTIGASLSAMYHVTFCIIRKKNPSIFSTFWSAYKSNFCKSTICFIVFALLIAFFGTDLYFVYFKLPDKYSVLQYPFWILLIACVSVMLYFFPITALFENTTKVNLKNSVLLSLSNFPTTVFFVFIPAAIIYYACLSGKNLIVVFSILIFFGCAAICYVYSVFLIRIFRRIQPDSFDDVDLPE